MLSEEKIADLRIKDLEFLQSLISRLSTYSAANKNYCITLTTAICGLALTTKAPYISLFSILPALLFFFMDGRYLRSERIFRTIYDKRRREDWSTKPSFDLCYSTEDEQSLQESLFSWSVLPFYSLLVLGIVLVFIALKHSL